MDLATTLVDFVRAAFTGVYIQTCEPEEALRDIRSACRRENWNVAVWDIDCGLAMTSNDNAVASVTDPLSAIRAIRRLSGFDEW